LDAQQLKLADRMIHLWVDFGRKSAGAKAWPTYDAKTRTVLELDALNRGGIKPSTSSWQSHQCDFWSAP
jgi:carboxylesterase type B